MSTFFHRNFTQHDLLSEDLVSFLYQGIQTSTQAPVLIWEYKKEWLTPTTLATLKRIGMKLSLVRHRHLLGVIETLEQDGTFFVITEAPQSWVTLEAYLQENHPAAKVWQLSIQLLDLMKALEQEKVLCGSLTLSQLWVTGDGQLLLSRVGIAIEVIKPNWQSLPALDEAIFYPPEFFLRGEYSVQSDLYAFGMVMWGMFSTSMPYQATHLVEKMKKELIQDPKPFSKRYPSLPDRISSLARICLAKEPAQRFGSFSEMIKRYNQNQILPIPVGEETTVQRELKSDLITERKGKLKSVVWVMLIVVLLGGLGVGIHTLFNRTVFSRQSRTIPDVIGMSVDEAKLKLTQDQLETVVIGYRVSAKYPEGTVIETRPEPGREVKESRLVQLIVSKGKGKQVAISLIGKTFAQAQELLPETVTINVVSRVYSTTYSKGVILSQTPSPNTPLDSEQVIQVVLSDGYPVDVQVTDANEPGKMKVDVTAFVPEKWASFSLEVAQVDHGKTTALLSQKVEKGTGIHQSFLVGSSARIWIKVDQKLIYDSSVQGQ